MNGRNTLNQSSGLFTASFEVGTDALGNIVEWDILLDLIDTSNAQTGDMNNRIFTRGNTFSFDQDGGRTDLASCNPMFGCSFQADVGFNTNNAGTWNAVTVSPVPIPAALPLFAGGLGLLGLLGWRRKRLAAA